jgi:D-3-phosphoglycerate dehydrogenase
MKKESLSKISIKRISTSPYFSPAFAQIEKEKIELIEGAKMLPLNSDDIAEILISNTHTNVSKIPKKQMEACRLWIHPNSGHDNLEEEFIREANFPIIVGNPIRAQAVANYILSALLSHYSPMPDLETHKKWNESRKWPRKILSELNILIIGQGHIGTILNNSLKNLAASVLTYDPYKGKTELSLSGIDVVIMACSLNKLNYHLIDGHFLTQLNKDFLLINAARGALVNTNDLLHTLAVQPLAHAVLDVFEEEPADFKIFEGVQNIIVTSHIAGVYKNIDKVTASFESEIISDFIHLEKDHFENKYKTVNLKNRLLQNNFLI